eukprot:scaffold1501_cov158-Amphora_coffeaeformis.AAC.11
MPGLRNLLHRSTSNRHTHKPLGGDDHSDDCLEKPLPVQKRVSADLSCTETSMSQTSFSSIEHDPAEMFEQFDAVELSARNHASMSKLNASMSKLNMQCPVSPCLAKVKNTSLASFLDNEMAKSSASSTRIVGKNGRASKGRSRRIKSGRSVCSMPAPRTSSTTTSSRSKAVPSAAHTKSFSESPRHHSRSKYETSAKSRVANKAAAMSAPMSAPTGRKQKVTLRNLPRTPALGGGPPFKGPHELYKSRSTRDLLKEYNNILDDFDDSARGPRSQALDLLEEYDQILTEYDDSARADRNTPYCTGWR